VSVGTEFPPQRRTNLVELQMVIPGQVRQRIASAQAVGDNGDGDAGSRDDELAEPASWVDLDLAWLAGLARPREETLGEALGIALDSLERCFKERTDLGLASPRRVDELAVIFIRRRGRGRRSGTPAR